MQAKHSYAQIKVNKYFLNKGEAWAYSLSTFGLSAKPVITTNTETPKMCETMNNLVSKVGVLSLYGMVQKYVCNKFSEEILQGV